MKITKLFAATLLATLAAGAAQASTDPVYPHPGTANATSYTFEAIATGEVYATFMSESADYTEVLGMATPGNTTPLGAVGLNNQTSTRGQTIDLGSVTAGEIVTFFIHVTSTGLTFSSDATQSHDHTSHVFSTAYAGSVSPYIPAGTYISFEDLDGPGSDHDYNDTAFVMTNVRVVPEPTNVALMLAGLGLLGAAARRRRS